MQTLNVEVSNRIRLQNPPIQFAQRVKTELTFDNPAYANAVRHGRSTRGISRKIRTYEEQNGDVWLPRGFWQRFNELARSERYGVDCVDKTVSFEPRFPPRSPTMWDYQEPWVVDMLSDTQGVGIAPPGSGKSIMGLEMYARLGQPCLWLTHTGRLVRQTRKKAEEMFGIETGIIGKGKTQLEHFTVGMVQTLIRRDLGEYQKKFGLIIIDECFPAGTLVDGKPIESVRVGDHVLSFDETTSLVDKRPVARLYKSRAKSLVRIMMSSGKTLVCTPGHPFWTKSGWRQAGTLTPNDEVLDYDREDSRGSKRGDPRAQESTRCRQEERRVSTRVRVDSVEILQPGSDGKFGGLCPDGHVYNIEVEGNHTYLVDGVVVHNCHHVPASTFSKVTSAFDARYRYGLTATPYRDDQLEELMFQIIGPARAYLDKETLRAAGKLMTPTVIRRPTAFSFPYNPHSRKHNYKALSDALATDKARNCQISTDVLIQSSLNEKNICIVLVGRITHGQALFDLLEPILPEVGFVHSGMSFKKSDEILDNFEAGEIRVLIATYRMLAEGFDYQPTNRLYLTAPYKGRTLIEQACGRIERTFPGKTDAYIFDYVDKNVGVLNRQADIRLDIYEANNTPVMTIT